MYKAKLIHYMTFDVYFPNKLVPRNEGKALRNSNNVSLVCPKWILPTIYPLEELIRSAPNWVRVKFISTAYPLERAA